MAESRFDPTTLIKKNIRAPLLAIKRTDLKLSEDRVGISQVIDYSCLHRSIRGLISAMHLNRAMPQKVFLAPRCWKF